MSVRIVAVQHGDYAEAMEIIGSNKPEPYYGMRNSLEVLQGLFKDHPHQVISLSAPRYQNTVENGQWIGLPAPRRIPGIPGTLGALAWGRSVCSLLRKFRPTHVLLRSGGILGWSVLRHCRRNRINVLALYASTFTKESSWFNKKIQRETIELLNEPNVFFVGNHRPPATQQLIDLGLNPSKVSSYDWPQTRLPSAFPVKSLDLNQPATIVFAGNMIRAKGVFDLLDAADILRKEGRCLRLEIYGTGSDLEEVRQRASRHEPGAIEVFGRVANDTVFDAMKRSTLVCVPSRHEFTEGMPLVLTESLASRTPVIASDHPVFVAAFREGEGLRFFPERNPVALAKVLAQTLSDPAQYAQLSQTTAQAFEHIASDATFEDLIQRWKKTF